MIKINSLGRLFSRVRSLRLIQIGRVGANAVGGMTAAMGALGVQSEMTNDIERKLMMTIQLSMSFVEIFS
jgi:hypothetical protein